VWRTYTAERASSTGCGTIRVRWRGGRDAFDVFHVHRSQLFAAGSLCLPAERNGRDVPELDPFRSVLRSQKPSRGRGRFPAQLPVGILTGFRKPRASCATARPPPARPSTPRLVAARALRRCRPARPASRIRIWTATTSRPAASKASLCLLFRQGRLRDPTLRPAPLRASASTVLLAVFSMFGGAFPGRASAVCGNSHGRAASAGSGI